MERLLVTVLAGLACPVGVLLSYALCRPAALLAFFGLGRGESLSNAVNGLRIALVALLFTMSFIVGLSAAFVTQTAR